MRKRGDEKERREERKEEREERPEMDKLSERNREGKETEIQESRQTFIKRNQVCVRENKRARESAREESEEHDAPSLFRGAPWCFSAVYAK